MKNINTVLKISIYPVHEFKDWIETWTKKRLIQTNVMKGKREFVKYYTEEFSEFLFKSFKYISVLCMRNKLKIRNSESLLVTLIVTINNSILKVSSYYKNKMSITGKYFTQRFML